MALFARIKPITVSGVTVDRVGGTAGAKQITAFDVDASTITMAPGFRVYDHMAGVIKPDETQLKVYETVCQPFVRKWVEGMDVDLITYGQTGSGKTYTMFGPPFSMETAAAALAGGSGAATAADVLRPEHGFILRSGLEALAAVEAINAGGTLRAVLHGSMVEMSIVSFTDQQVIDLLNRRQMCYVDKGHHLQGAMMKPLRSASDVVQMAAAVETRLVRGTRMNDTSSRSHCCAVYTLTVLNIAEQTVRTSRFQCFDLMGSERFKGGNAAHDSRASSKVRRACEFSASLCVCVCVSCACVCIDLTLQIPSFLPSFLTSSSSSSSSCSLEWQAMKASSPTSPSPPSSTLSRERRRTVPRGRVRRSIIME
jgi:hypothetical protein